MRRQVFDVLAKSVGVIIVVVLLIAGGLLTWGGACALTPASYPEEREHLGHSGSG